MNPLQLPWLEASLVALLAGAGYVSALRDPARAYRWGCAFTGLAFVGTFLAWLGFYLEVPPSQAEYAHPQLALFGTRFFALDQLNAPLLPAVALLHFLTALATTRTKMRRFSFSWSLTTGAIHLATFSCTAAWLLPAFLLVGTLPPYVELVNRGRPTRVYLLHMLLFAGLLAAGWALMELGDAGTPPSLLAVSLLSAALLVRIGSVPAHCWVLDWFEQASFGIALLYLVPMAGIYTFVRLVLPLAPDDVLRVVAVFSLLTAVYGAGMAAVQRDLRRLYAYLFISHAALVLVGLELHAEASVTAALCLWFSVMIALAGFGLTLRALESRFGRLDLSRHLGLYEHAPTLAVCFLLTGLASVGFPGTLGFISMELLIEGAIEYHLAAGLAVIAAAALNSIAVVRAYLLIFTGARHASTVSLDILTRERIALLLLALLILGGGLFPQAGVATRQKAAEEILRQRRQTTTNHTPLPVRVPAH